MNEKTIEANAPAIVPEEENRVVSPTEDDLEAKYTALEAEKARLLDESSNYKMAYLKERSKRGSLDSDDEEERLRRIVDERLADSSLAKVNKEQEDLIKKTLKENKELRLAHLNRTGTPPAAMGTHSEGQPVRDTLISSEQMASFKAAGKDDKWIENYKKNWKKAGGR